MPRTPPRTVAAAHVLAADKDLGHCAAGGDLGQAGLHRVAVGCGRGAGCGAEGGSTGCRAAAAAKPEASRAPAPTPVTPTPPLPSPWLRAPRESSYTTVAGTSSLWNRALTSEQY